MPERTLVEKDAISRRSPHPTANRRMEVLSTMTSEGILKIATGEGYRCELESSCVCRAWRIGIRALVEMPALRPILGLRY